MWKKGLTWFAFRQIFCVVQFWGSLQFCSHKCLPQSQYHIILMIVTSWWVSLSSKACPSTLLALSKMPWPFFHMNFKKPVSSCSSPWDRFISHLFLKGIFTGCRILGWQFFPFSLEKYSNSSILHVFWWKSMVFWIFARESDGYFLPSSPFCR